MGTALDHLLSVVPGTAGVGHEESHEHTRHGRSGKEASKGLDTEDATDDDGGKNRGYTRKDHLPKCGIGRDRHTARGIRLLRPVHDTGLFTELPPDFLHHTLRRTANSRHREGSDEERQHPAYEQPDHNQRIDQVDAGLVQPHLAGIGGEQRERRQCCGANGESLALGSSRISDRIQGVGDRTRFPPQATHLADSARVVRNRTVRVNRHGHTDGRQHSNRSYANPVQAGGQERGVNRNTNEEHGNGRGLHADGKPRDQIRCGPRLTGFGDLSDWPRGCVVLGD